MHFFHKEMKLKFCYKTKQKKNPIYLKIRKYNRYVSKIIKLFNVLGKGFKGIQKWVIY